MNEVNSGIWAILAFLGKGKSDNLVNKTVGELENNHGMLENIDDPVILS